MSNQIVTAKHKNLLRNFFSDSCMYDNQNNRAVGLANVTSTDPYDCQKKCQANPSCVFFVYDKSNLTCLLKKESGAKKGENAEGFVTGPNHCSLMGESCLFKKVR